MNARQWIKLINDRAAIVAVLDVLFLFLPGVLVIFEVNPELFSQLEWHKLAILSAAFLTPLVFINTMLFLWSFEVEKEGRDDFFGAFSLGTVASGIVFFGSLFVRLFDAPFSQDFFSSALIFECFIVILICVGRYQFEAKSKSKKS